ncbi:MAG: tRNA pseudouridine(55) synthase TruB [Bacteroidetes bacterium]|nr:tRNA pseudouridine(55) synthase TruB [Bacteroidota bacterium]
MIEPPPLIPSVANNIRVDFNQGCILPVNKPAEWTSFDVVKKIRNTCKAKVGHAGTLDPLATGLLILCTGKLTKKLDEIQGMVKEYTGTMILGASTPTYDSELPPDNKYPTDHIDEALIMDTVKQFTGKIKQRPPIYSAIKVEGEALYKKARRGESVEIKTREVQIDEFEISNIDGLEISFSIRCSKGTYVRSLAHDFGKALNSGAYLATLCRTRIGTFSIEDAWDLDDLVKWIKTMRDADS